MPKIYEYFGLIFFFYSNEHLPIHVHVSFGEYESKFELRYESGRLSEINVKSVKGRRMLPLKEIAEVKFFINTYHEGIVEKWTTFFVRNTKVTCEIIKNKVK